MSDILHTQFENENSFTKYPFSRDSSLVAEDGYQLPCGFAVDAVLYTIDGACRLVEMVGGKLPGSIDITLDSAGRKLKGTMLEHATFVDFVDEQGVNRGSLVLGPDAATVASDPTKHVFNNLAFSSVCQFALGEDYVKSVNIGSDVVLGDVNFLSAGTGRTVVKAVSSKKSDGEYDLRFDVLPNTGISTLSNTGIRVIHVLRQPGSAFNVLDRDGELYLFLTKNGLMSKTGLIDRTMICSNKKTGETDAIDKSKTEDCGKSASADGGRVYSRYCGVGTGSWDSYAATRQFVEKRDTLAIKINESSYAYGYYSCGEENGYGTHPTLSVMFIEGEVSASFVAYNYAVMAHVIVSVTDAAAELFLAGSLQSRSNAFSIPLKRTAYRSFYDYFNSRRHGKLGYVDEDIIVGICKEMGWFANDDDIGFPDGVDDKEATLSLTEELRSSGLSKSSRLYTIRSRDFFEHFNCRNWEVSSADFLGDEVRWLVGWGPRTASSFFSSASSHGYTTVNAEDGEKITIPNWMIAKELWWKKYSKTSSGVRYFIVPKERGLTIYTGDEQSWVAGLSPGTSYHATKEYPPLSWDCGRPAPWQTTGLVTEIARNDYMLYVDTMREKLHTDYSSEPADTSDTVVFYSMDWITLENKSHEVRIDVLENVARLFNNRVTSETRVVQPSDAPIYSEGADETYLSGDYWLGPFEYEYDKMYIPGVGYDDPSGSEDWREAEAIKAPISFQFDISKSTTNSFTIDTTDLVADGISYLNPIHIKASESVQASPTIAIDDPTDSSEVSDKMETLTSRQTSGNGIEISIPGL